MKPEKPPVELPPRWEPQIEFSVRLDARALETLQQLLNDMKPWEMSAGLTDAKRAVNTTAVNSHILIAREKDAFSRLHGSAGNWSRYPVPPRRPIFYGPSEKRPLAGNPKGYQRYD